MFSDFVKQAQAQGLKINRDEMRDIDREAKFEADVLDSTDFIDDITGATA